MTELEKIIAVVRNRLKAAVDMAEQFGQKDNLDFIVFIYGKIEFEEGMKSNFGLTSVKGCRVIPFKPADKDPLADEDKDPA